MGADHAHSDDASHAAIAWHDQPLVGDARTTICFKDTAEN
jgi:hypothetical protein